ncbi:AMP-binding enzyme family protein (macronuclear) [Tetrahymena thermophila SB210]|uniref:AMP-binding enzyme family protein n=1 Tax=Tetrahymena thermophila (strain SB210) TaxID=312017 RepID=A4VDR8_TETTS|nr:AMP-binding enzyme family protein [Tetrahymena thermophila SB210]EDK31677.2 AMP-binding enzyme family protein [Tetrahymena thermophila SB210]|eukprot:XP_001471359.2 AMP-binding enzyme family protein [Tetrahymena thermophila SB210]
MNFTKIDIFSQPFFFHLDNKRQEKKGSIIGALLTLTIFIVTLTYFAYLTKQYLTNQINPKYRSQSFISEDNIEIDLREDLIAFRYEYDTNKIIDLIQNQQNKTYVVNYALFNYQNGLDNEIIQLEIVKCSIPELEGYNCLNFSNMKNKTIVLNTRQRIFTQIIIRTYNCYQTDQIKKTIPDNCADQNDISQLISGSRAGFRIKLFASQYNISSQQNQVSYRNQFIFLNPKQTLLTTISAQKQVTTVNKGFLIQVESKYSFPIQFNQQNQSYELDNKPLSQVSYQVDEVIQYIEIQFPTFPEILALVNSTLALLMTIGFFGRKIAQNAIKRDFFFLFLQTIYKDTYEQILQINKLFDQKKVAYLKKRISKYEIAEENEDKILTNFALIRSQSPKKLSFLDSNQFMQQSRILLSQEGFQDTLQSQSKEVEKVKIPKPILNIESSPQQSKNSFRLDSFAFSQKNQSRSPKMNSQKIPFQNQNLKSSDSIQVIKTRRYSNCNNQKINLTNQVSNQIQKNNESQSQIINQTTKEEVQNYYIQKIKTFSDMKVIQNTKKLIFKKSFWKKEAHSKFDDINEQTKKLIEQQVSRSLNILEFYKDIIFLKKAIMVLLSKEQLAAINLIGCSPKTFDKKLNIYQKTNNYFQKQMEIYSSEKLQCKYTKNFIQICLNSQNLEKVDYRIISSIIKEIQN